MKLTIKGNELKAGRTTYVKGRKLPRKCPVCDKFGSKNCICGDNK